jgi:glycosyltransferase involved in cell wall biosynthesis
MGLRSSRWPLEFDQAPDRLGSRLKHLGPVADRAQYWRWLFWGDVVVSTARQEYQGLAVAEAVWAGCRPLLPHALAYPEIYPERFLYQPGRFLDSLRVLLADPDQVRKENARALVEGFTWQAQRESWSRLLEQVVSQS